jgi:transaldolase
MKVFLITSRVPDVQWAAAGGLAEGVVTTPALLNEIAEGARYEHLADLCRVAPIPVCASVRSVAPDDIYRDGRELARISDQILVQVPLIEDAMPAVRRLRADGVRVLATLVYTATQAILAAKAGAFMVEVAVDQLDEAGQDGTAVVDDVCAIFGAHAVECDIMASRPQHAAQFSRCAHAGADVAAITPDLLRTLLLHPLTDRGLDHLLRDLSVHHHPRASV